MRRRTKKVVKENVITFPTSAVESLILEAYDMSLFSGNSAYGTIDDIQITHAVFAYEEAVLEIDSNGKLERDDVDQLVRIEFKSSQPALVIHTLVTFEGEDEEVEMIVQVLFNVLNPDSFNIRIEVLEEEDDEYVPQHVILHCHNCRKLKERMEPIIEAGWTSHTPENFGMFYYYDEDNGGHEIIEEGNPIFVHKSFTENVSVTRTLDKIKDLLNKKFQQHLTGENPSKIAVQAINIAAFGAITDLEQMESLYEKQVQRGSKNSK